MARDKIKQTKWRSFDAWFCFWFCTAALRNPAVPGCVKSHMQHTAFFEFFPWCDTVLAWPDDSAASVRQLSRARAIQSREQVGGGHLIGRGLGAISCGVHNWDELRGDSLIRSWDREKVPMDGNNSRHFQPQFYYQISAQYDLWLCFCHNLCRDFRKLRHNYVKRISEKY